MFFEDFEKDIKWRVSKLEQLEKENEKLKKAIKLLKNMFYLKVVVFKDNNGGYLDYFEEYLVDNRLDKYDCELLEEVLKNDK